MLTISTLPELVVPFSRSLRVPTTSELWRRRRRKRETDSAATGTAMERDPFLCSGATTAPAATAASGSQPGRAGSQEEQVWRVGQDGRDGALRRFHTLSPSPFRSLYTFCLLVARYSLAPGGEKDERVAVEKRERRSIAPPTLRPGRLVNSVRHMAYEELTSTRLDTPCLCTGVRGRSRVRSRIRHRRESRVFLLSFLSLTLSPPLLSHRFSHSDRVRVRVRGGRSG